MSELSVASHVKKKYFKEVQTSKLQEYFLFQIENKQNI